MSFPQVSMSSSVAGQSPVGISMLSVLKFIPAQAYVPSTHYRDTQIHTHTHIQRHTLTDTHSHTHIS